MGGSEVESLILWMAIQRSSDPDEMVVAWQCKDSTRKINIGLDP